MLIAELIKRRRLELEMTQTQLAANASLTPAAISQFESGTRKPSFNTLSSLADALKVTTDYLLGKRKQNYDDLLADPQVGLMFRGLMGLPEKDKEIMLEFYQFLKSKNDKET
ncbi:MAG: helix-turn-helix transcriptional regulator [Candidatus Poribacteria bacterium]|jgi:transcriptional regulator with XRE-family HTH domain|nr:helix-turn-helix transcriptional regulator [Candidatus Poribacteria bacterium]MDP6745787.1 helix-turn-helix transcriptional regulator [Candidatus Poribacteria bacterium]MDP6995105.1 helix-turn-helix transcriptional regulator [Candidatus Poribacteria bacterium]